MAKVLLSMPDEFLKSIDKRAETENCSRSQLIREALRVYFRKNAMKNVKSAGEKAKILEDLLS